MKRNIILFLLVLLTLPYLESCKNADATSSRNNDEPEVPAEPSHPQMLAVLYQQHAGEYKALCYQAFSLARLRLDQRLEENRPSGPFSVVVDIDETVLDNSPYEARCIVENVIYPEGWDKWMKEASARAIPGALEFLQYAHSKGAEVYYISNRDEIYFEETLQNLKKLGFPFAFPDHLLLKRAESSKEDRRKRVDTTTEIVLLIGDNLGDFSNVFENKSSAERSKITDRFSEEFGNKYIVLPNAIYGDWLKALHNYDYSLTPEQKDEMLKQALILK